MFDNVHWPTNHYAAYTGIHCLYLGVRNVQSRQFELDVLLRWCQLQR